MRTFIWFLTKLTGNDVVHKKDMDTKYRQSVSFSDSFTCADDVNLTILTFSPSDRSF